MPELLFPDEIRVRSDVALRKAVYAAARQQHCSASEFVRRLLRRELTDSGVLVPEAASAKPRPSASFSRAA